MWLMIVFHCHIIVTVILKNKLEYLYIKTSIWKCENIYAEGLQQINYNVYKHWLDGPEVVLCVDE